MAQELTIGSAVAAGIRWENWNDFRARALDSLIADYLGRRAESFAKKKLRGASKTTGGKIEI